MNYIAVLLTVFNRREKTLRCLNNLLGQYVPKDYTLDVWLTNDGCTDGTPEDVKTLFPEVHIINGDGTLFWNRGMHKAWEAATAYRDYEYYIWLNDDTFLYRNALLCLLQVSEKKQNSIIVGTTCATNNKNRITYGGRMEDYSFVYDVSCVKECSLFNGNIVLIPQHVYKVLGTNDPIFRHALGDFDYGMRAIKAGFVNYVAPGIIGECDEHYGLPVWCDWKKSIFQRWQAFKKPTGQNPEEFFIFEKRHHGLTQACFHYMTNYARMLFPWIWLLKSERHYRN